MKAGVLLKIAKTHLLAKKKQTIIAALGVTFGIGTFIIMVSFMTGLNGLLDGLILNRTPHIRIYNEVKASDLQPVQLLPQYSKAWHIIHSVKPRQDKLSIHNNQPLMSVLRKDKRVKGVTPMVAARVFYVSGAIQLNGTLSGIDISEQIRLFNFGDYITKGSPDALAQTDNGIIIGAGVAKKLSLDLGDFVQVVSGTGTVMRLKIVGFFQSGLADIDNIQSYANIKTTQRIQGMSKDYITDIYVKLFDINNAVPMTRMIKSSYGLNAVDIKTANAQFETGTSIRNMITYAVSVALLIVAGFGIYNILNMLIFQKMNDIAILKATGFSSGDVRRIFLYQAMMIGIAGGILGLIIGYLVSVLISHSPFETEALPTIHTFPVNFDVQFYVTGTIFALLTTFLAGLMPARKASKIDPVEILQRTMTYVLEARNINKHFYDPVDNHVIRDVNLSIKKGEFVSIMGKSGCGKSTLLYILSTMDTNYQGQVVLNGKSLTGMGQRELSTVRNQNIGFVFQFHYLLPEFSVLDNIMLPALKLGLKSRDEIEHDAITKLRLLDIPELATKMATQISGGQKQRVAIARSLINSPSIIMGDEPTGNLDSKNADLVFGIFRDLSAENGQSMLVVTHDHDFANRTDRIIEMADGRIV